MRLDGLDTEIKYYKGLPYIVAESFQVRTQIFGLTIEDDLASLMPDGILAVRKWYPSDGNSGPCYDFRLSIKAAIVHDVLCEWINQGLLTYRVQPLVDKLYYDIAVARGLWGWVARIRLIAVTWYMAGKGNKKLMRKILKA